MRKYCAGVVALAVALLAGCSYSPNWPKQPSAVIGAADSPDAVVYRLGGREHPQYKQAYHDGVKRTLYFDADGDGDFEEVADLNQLDAAKIHRVFILLDGLPYEIMNELYREGHFRLFYPPSVMSSSFPSLTDIAYSGMFGISGTSCYESVIYNPQTNKLEEPVGVYLTGNNELWSSRLDYRQNLWVDAISYIYPVYANHREYHAMFDKAGEVLEGRPEQQNVLIYSISTDAAAHMVGWQRTKELLIELDAYIERLMYDRKGQLGLVMLADHGNNFAGDCKRVDVEGGVRSAGLTPVLERGFKKPGEVIVPTYGLLSLVRAYCQNESDRRKLVDAWLTTEGIEHVMWFKDDTAYIARRVNAGQTLADAAQAAIHYRTRDGKEYFSYTPTQGDPLELQPLLKPLKATSFEGSDEKFYEARDLLAATYQSDWPDALYRIWHGMTDDAAVVPDVAASLDYGYYYGSRRLDAFAKLHGTHGGLKKRDTNTFFMTSMFAAPPVMRTDDVPGLVNDHFLWKPPFADPATAGLQKYLHREKPIGPAMRNLK